MFESFRNGGKATSCIQISLNQTLLRICPCPFNSYAVLSKCKHSPGLKKSAIWLSGTSTCRFSCRVSNLRLAQGKQNFRATCPKGELDFKLFSSPAAPYLLLVYRCCGFRSVQYPSFHVHSRANLFHFCSHFLQRRPQLFPF